MRPKFSIVTTVFDTFHLLPRLLNCVSRQTDGDWELLLTVDGSPPANAYSPERLAEQMRRRHAERRIDVWELPRAEGCYGNVGRRFALDHGRGEYVCWVNHDNLIAPDYLAAHRANIEKTPGCVSVVDVDLWQGGRYHGVYPRALARSRIDLLCFAVPRETALAVDAFGPATERVYAADWMVFEACSRLHPVEHARRVVGAHF